MTLKTGLYVFAQIWSVQILISHLAIATIQGPVIWSTKRVVIWKVPALMARQRWNQNLGTGGSGSCIREVFRMFRISRSRGDFGRDVVCLAEGGVDGRWLFLLLHRAGWTHIGTRGGWFADVKQARRWSTWITRRFGKSS